MPVERYESDHIGPQRHVRRADAWVAALAARQHGVVARRQLASAGLGPGWLRHRVRTGRLHRIHPGVYAVGHARLSQHGHWMAAVLAAGRDAVLNARAAAALFGIRPSTTIEVAAPTQKRPHRFLIHRCAIPPDERTTHQGIPTTTPARTLLDLAALIPPHQLERAINEAEHLNLTSPGSLTALLQRHPRRRGTAALRTITARRADGTQRTRSELEARFLHFLDAHDLPRPRTNHTVHGYECDAVWPDTKLIAELDGHAAHKTRQAFERDRAKDRHLATHGWRPIRITWHQLTQQPETLAKDIRALASRPQ